ncbi:hypothetical protein GCM10023089_31940 [Quisquiliibacterium transsilvanicum]
MLYAARTVSRVRRSASRPSPAHVASPAECRSPSIPSTAAECPPRSRERTACGCSGKQPRHCSRIDAESLYALRGLSIRARDLLFIIYGAALDTEPSAAEQEQNRQTLYRHVRGHLGDGEE